VLQDTLAMTVAQLVQYNLFFDSFQLRYGVVSRL